MFEDDKAEDGSWWGAVCVIVILAVALMLCLATSGCDMPKTPAVKLSHAVDQL